MSCRERETKLVRIKSPRQFNQKVCDHAERTNEVPTHNAFNSKGGTNKVQRRYTR